MTQAVGIDLGTTYSALATLTEGRPRLVPNSEGSYLTPSVVAFAADGTPLVGERARQQALSGAAQTIFSIKRQMGSGFRVHAGGREYAPEAISALILQKVKAGAELQLGERIEQAVITVPAYFNDRQRQATRQAAALAGIEVLRLLNEPTAAALSYGLLREDAHTILVWDLGGGTFDVSILELGEGLFEVRAVGGDSWLGGDDFDTLIASRAAEECRIRMGVDLLRDPSTAQQLRRAAEAAKIRLSTAAETILEFPLPPAQAQGQLDLRLSQDDLRSLGADLLDRMATTTRRVLADAGKTAKMIDRVILVGGATRMPIVRQLARELLQKEPYRYLDPDTVVALGAAVQAGMLLGQIERAVLLDVLPLGLGVETQGGLMTRLIHRNTPLPASGSRIFATAADYQTSMDIHVLQGERALAADDVSLGEFHLSGIPAADRGRAKVEVSIEADVDGIVHITAIDLQTETQVDVELASAKFLDRDEIEAMAAEAARRAEADRAAAERVQAGIAATSTLAAAELVIAGLAPADVPARSAAIRSGIGRLREAVHSGFTDDLQAQSADLRRLLATQRPLA